MEQITFEDIELQAKQARLKAAGHELDRRCKAVALSLNRSELAAVNDLSYSYISEMLNTNNEQKQKPWQMSLIPSLAVENPERFAEEVLFFLCDLCGREYPEKKRDLTVEEELTAYKRIIKDRGLEPLFNLNRR